MEEERRTKRVAIAENVAHQMEKHMATEDQEKERVKQWHIGKEIPIAVIVVLILQTAGVIWWAASTSVKVEFMKETNVASQLVQTSIDRRQDDEAKRSEDRILVQLDKINVKLDRITEIKFK